MMPLDRDDARVLANQGYLDRVRGDERGWNDRDDGYHWHDFDGRRVCHHYDPDDGIHWWGWYFGSYYFWSPYYAGYWWWYDPYWHRWLFLYNGGWWWQGPDQIYVYDGGNYYAYEDSIGGEVMVPDATPPVERPPQDPDGQEHGRKTYYSADGTRMIVVSGQNEDAYLYDTATPPAFDPVYLGSGVTEVRFENNADGSISEILTITGDGGFQVYDRDGYSIGSFDQSEGQDQGASGAALQVPRAAAASAARKGISLRVSGALGGLRALGTDGSSSW
ncbi:MAG: hypothetical protein KGL04_08980 [Elusimicrobia bacterium]|nr:hypothetical protein [Elusimicrobiota bacterium]